MAPRGIGKSTFAAQFPESMFIDTEGSTTHMDVKRFARPTSWTMLLDQVKYVKANPTICKTLAIDTGDWAELLCIEHVCSKAQKRALKILVMVKAIHSYTKSLGVYLMPFKKLSTLVSMLL